MTSDSQVEVLVIFLCIFIKFIMLVTSIISEKQQSHLLFFCFKYLLIQKDMIEASLIWFLSEFLSVESFQMSIYFCAAQQSLPFRHFGR
jgi:hypothetical protein